ncbi:MAG: sulfatase [Verrucomicrobiota bacterium]
MAMKRFFLILLGLVALGVGGGEAGEKRPNVLFIAIDDLNDWVGCLGGHPDALTPNMDRLAKRGTLFTNAHCQAPICGPSRASLLSGTYPHTNGLYAQPGGKGLVEDRELFRGHLMPEYFAAQGYATFGCGKITHGYPMDVAFEVWGKKAGGSSGPKPGKERFNYEPDYRVPFTGTQTDWGAFPERDDEMPDHDAANWAIERLGEAHEEPFFLAVGFVRPHVPFYVPQKWFDLFPIDDVILPEIPEGDLDDVPETGIAMHEMPRYPDIDWLRENDSEQLRKCVQAYLACTTYVDSEVGRVLDALDASAYADDTVIVLFSDHGYHLGEKDRVSKHSLWEESTRVPMIVVVPGGKAGVVRGEPVGLIDMYPTLTELCGLPAKESNEGVSLVPLLDGSDAAEWREAVVTTYARGSHALRSEGFRYIRYEDGAEELYDHARDPDEWTNLAGNPEYREELKRFRGLVPAKDAPYHAASRAASVNAWFEEHMARNGVRD